MLKFRLIAGSPDRLAKLLDRSEYHIETSRMDEALANEFGEARDDSPTNEMEVIQGDKDD